MGIILTPLQTFLASHKSNLFAHPHRDHQLSISSLLFFQPAASPSGLNFQSDFQYFPYLRQVSRIWASVFRPRCLALSYKYIHKSARCHNRIFVLQKLPPGAICGVCECHVFRSAAGSASGIAPSPLYNSRFYKYLQCARTYAMYLYNTSARCEGNNDHDDIVGTGSSPNEGGQAYDWPFTPSKSFVSLSIIDPR